MQLKKIKKQMAVATCALLQVATPLANAAETDWDVDTAFLYYGEGDGRVQAFEPAIHAGRDLGDDERIDLRIVVDALTGATPNGAYATPGTAQTFTTPSGDSAYTIAAGDQPLDRRVQGNHLSKQGCPDGKTRESLYFAGDKTRGFSVCFGNRLLLLDRYPYRRKSCTRCRFSGQAGPGLGA